MKKEVVIIVIVIALIIVGFFIIQQPEKPEKTVVKESEPTTSLLTYTDINYKIKYLSNWEKNEEIEGIIGFVSPQEGSSDKFSENFNIIVGDLSAQPMTLSEYTELTITEVEEAVEGFNIIGSEATVLSGNEAHKIIFTGRMPPYSLKWLQIWTIKEDKVYLLTYTAEPDEFDKYLGDIQIMIDSFEII